MGVLTQPVRFRRRGVQLESVPGTLRGTISKADIKLKDEAG
jgi:hypothetical protein